MGLVELVLALLFGAPAAVAGVLALRLRPSEPAERPAVPVVAVAVVALVTLLGGAVGLLLAPPFVHGVVLRGFEGTAVVSEPFDGWRANLAGAQVTVCALGLPGLVALAWLMIRRSVPGAVAVAVATGVGFAVAVGLATWGLDPMVPPDDGTVIVFTLVGLVQAQARILTASGLVGAAVGSAAAVAATELRAALWLTVCVPVGALVAAALVTPPDVVSQVLLAVMIGVAWGVGLALGAVVWALRRRARAVQAS